MTELKHSPEPWTWSGHHEWIEIYDEADGCVSHFANEEGIEGVTDLDRANAARIVACVNALGGLNPEGVRPLAKAVRAMLPKGAIFPVDLKKGVVTLSLVHVEQVALALRNLEDW